MLKRWLCVAVLSVSLAGCETTDLEGMGSVLADIQQGLETSGTNQSGLTTLEIDQGLREALTVGVNLTAQSLGRQDGYFANPTIHIPLPGRLGELQSSLGSLGLSQPLDDLELRMNRAAEAAIPDAKSLVLAAVRQITLEDAVGILSGGDTAATDYLRGKTEPNLRTAFKPYIEQALTESGAFSVLDSVAGQHGMSSLTTSLRSDLTTHAVNLGLDGLFYYVAVEEKKIREEPVARTSEILRRVFGANV